MKNFKRSNLVKSGIGRSFSWCACCGVDFDLPLTGKYFPSQCSFSMFLSILFIDFWVFCYVCSDVLKRNTTSNKLLTLNMKKCVMINKKERQLKERFSQNNGNIPQEIESHNILLYIFSLNCFNKKKISIWNQPRAVDSTAILQTPADTFLQLHSTNIFISTLKHV